MDYMEIALEEAKKAFDKGEVPVGAVIVKDGVILSKAHNLKETLNNPLAHAELIAIEEASKVMGNWRLKGCSMYVTLEPCPMCGGAIVQSRISNLYIGTFDPRAGACGTVINLVQNDSFNHFVKVNWLYNQECSKILEDFFKVLRSGKNY